MRDKEDRRFDDTEEVEYDPIRDGEIQVGHVWVNSHFKGSAFGGDSERSGTTEIKVPAFDPRAGVAKVRAGFGMTLNLGNYNSARVDVQVELPCYPSEVDAAIDSAFGIAQDRVESEVQAVKADLNG